MTQRAAPARDRQKRATGRKQALSDLVILDFTHMLAGPYATMLLADLGAETIKIEPIEHGEGTRKLLATDPDFSRSGMGAYFLTLNRNKKSVCIDLKRAEGRAVLYDLVKKADVVVDNFAPGVTKRLGIDHATLTQHNPRIVTCSISGFGETGPSTDRPAFDMVAQGIGGGMSITGEIGGRPLRAGIPIGDLGGGMFGAIGILSALHARALTGEGQHVDISMLDGQISLLNYMATMHLLSGIDPAPLGNGHFVHVPYDTFKTKTQDLIIAVITDGFWTSLVEALGLDTLRNPAFVTQPGRFAQKDHINSEIQKLLLTESCAHWLTLLEARRIPCAPVNTLASALHDPQVRARNMVVSVNHPDGSTVQMPGNPVKLSRTGEDSFAPPPLLGQHTDTVLNEYLGLSPNAIMNLHDQRVIG